jgi:hypothetical protein
MVGSLYLSAHNYMKYFASWNVLSSRYRTFHLNLCALDFCRPGFPSS